MSPSPRREKVLLSWSSGKDCAWALHRLRLQGMEVVGLLTTYNEAFDRVSMHGVRREVVRAQARAAGLRVWWVKLPWPCSAEDYETRMTKVVRRARRAGITAIAFADLHLEDVRAYREERLREVGIRPLFPLWTTPEGTHRLAEEMLGGGLRAWVCCVDPRRLHPRFLGREYDWSLLTDLPAEVDPCGERGEFHTVCWAGPMFSRPVALEAGGRVEREGFCFLDFRLTDRS